MGLAHWGRRAALALLGVTALAANPQEEAQDDWSSALAAARADLSLRDTWLSLLAKEPLDYERQVAANSWAFELAQSGDLAGANRVYPRMRMACEICHRDFRPGL